MRGHVDAIDASRVVGWAFDPADPQRRSKIRVILDGKLICQGTTGVVRPDVETAFKISGEHGFCIASEELKLIGAGDLYRAQVQASSQNNIWVDLPVSSKPSEGLLRNGQPDPRGLCGHRSLPRCAQNDVY